LRRAALAVAALTISCASPPAQEPATRAETQVYYCPENYQFVARAGRENVWLFLQDGEVTLPAVSAASGAKYANATTTFWAKGDEALLETPQGAHKGCATHPSSGTWKEGRDRGVTFRATGNEPGWVVEIGEGGETTLSTDYGESRHRFSTPEPERAGDRLLYESTSESANIAIEIERKPCRDGMSGFPFQATVEVRVEGKSYRGCGNWIPNGGA
jgi:putative lipoprotein